MLKNKYYINVQYIQQISGLGTFIDNIESIGQDDFMTEQGFAKSSPVSYDRSLDILT